MMFIIASLVKKATKLIASQAADVSSRSPLVSISVIPSILKDAFLTSSLKQFLVMPKYMYCVCYLVLWRWTPQMGFPKCKTSGDYFTCASTLSILLRKLRMSSSTCKTSSALIPHVMCDFHLIKIYYRWDTISSVRPRAVPCSILY